MSALLLMLVFALPFSMQFLYVHIYINIYIYVYIFTILANFINHLNVKKRYREQSVFTFLVLDFALFLYFSPYVYNKYTNSSYSLHFALSFKCNNCNAGWHYITIYKYIHAQIYFAFSTDLCMCASVYGRLCTNIHNRPHVHV